VKRLYNRRVVMAGVVDAIPGQKIENAAPLACVKLRAGAALVANIHLQDFEQLNPLRIYMIRIEFAEFWRGRGVYQKGTSWKVR
jgi:hypothetical protein